MRPKDLWTKRRVLANLPGYETRNAMPDSDFQPRLSELKQQRRPLLALAIALLTCFCLIVIGVQVWSVLHAREIALRNSEVATANMARALASHAATSIKLGDAVLSEIVGRIERDGLGARQGESLRARMVEVQRSVDELHGLFVYAPDGKWLLSSLPEPMQGNNFDREYFQYHLKHPGRGLHIGTPVRSRSTGVWILPLSRRIDHPDGSFAGVALATLDLAWFDKFYDSFDVGASGTILMLLDNGTLVYRRPFRGDQVGIDVRSGPVWQLYKKHGPVGTAIMTPQIDNIERLYSYRHLEDYPLLVASAQSMEEVLAEWRALAIKMSVVIGASLLLLAWGGTVMVRQIRVREQLEAELRRSSNALKRHNRSLKALAESDGLTGLANRRLFEETLEREYDRARRAGAPFAVIMCDVDHFKKFNDRYGHVSGDDCLRRVAGAIAESARRPTDLAARYGGEEFALVLPDTDLEGACAVAEKIRAAVAGLRLAHADSPPGHVTVSLGVYSARPLRGGGDALAWVEAADALLYEAKASGRNRLAARGGQAVAA